MLPSPKETKPQSRILISPSNDNHKQLTRYLPKVIWFVGTEERKCSSLLTPTGSALEHILSDYKTVCSYLIARPSMCRQGAQEKPRLAAEE